MIRFVHCVTDEKFTKNIVTTFDFLADSCHSSYVYIVNDGKPKALKYIANNTSVEHLKIEELMIRLRDGQYDVLFLHNLRSMPLEHISQIPENLKVVWLAWGFDIYSRVGTRPLVEMNNPYHQETRKLIKPTAKEWVANTSKLIYRWAFRDRLVHSAVSRVDFFSGIIPEEYDLMCNNPFFHAKRIDYRYSSPLSNISLDLLRTEQPARGMNIMVGNSGDPTNNHADIFYKLAQLDLGDRKIFAPLSYAGSLRYRRQVKDLGERFWGNRFVAIQDFMPVAEYKSVISSCGFRIFGHERQQAMGNIRLAFRAGCKVFLSESSILYRHHVDMGLKVYTIQNDILNGEVLALPSEDEAYSNRKIAIEDSLTSKQIERLLALLAQISNSEMRWK